jgi:hypothetical protein
VRQSSIFVVSQWSCKPPHIPHVGRDKDTNLIVGVKDAIVVVLRAG